MGKKKNSAKTSPSVPSIFPSLFAAQHVTPHRICAREQHNGRKKTGKNTVCVLLLWVDSETMGQDCHSLAINLLCNLCQIKHSASVSPLGNSKVLYFKLHGVHQALYEKPPELWPAEFHTGISTDLLAATFPPKCGFFSFTAAPPFQLLSTTYVSQKHNTPRAPCSCASKSYTLRHSEKVCIAANKHC